MKFEQEESFKPLTITIETKEEYIALEQIIDDANNIPAQARQYMRGKAAELGIVMANWFSNNA